ncbi:MAG: sugar ABC transporter ATP-binding protein, partial [Terriglobales bacterium]
PELKTTTVVNRLAISVQQLVEIARAIALGCRVLILDEPTSSLTGEDVEHLFQVIKELKERDYAIIYISHFIEEIQRIADRFTVLRDGKTVGGGEMAQTAPEEIVALMVGRDVKEIYPRSPRPTGEVALSINNLSADNRLEEATLSLRRGEVVGVAGLMGSGRTELLRAIFGLDQVLSGEIRVFQYEGPATPAQRWKQGVGMVSENRKEEGLALNMSIAENLILPMPARIESHGMISPGRMKEAARQWIDTLSVRCHEPMQPVGSLSGGNQQKVAIARLLYRDADVYLLDEPTRGIDVGSKVQIYGLIDRLACDNKAVVIVSSYLPELLGICDRIAVMCKGRLGPARPVAEVDEHSLMVEATALEVAGAP